ncbi:MAG: hypothetical protein P0S94_04025 [Simkaniaceae bacterium]|nr:hypothetical protein [Simkaniaceae bacterium]
MKKEAKENKPKKSLFSKKQPQKEAGERDPKKKLLTAYGWKMLTETLN